MPFEFSGNSRFVILTKEYDACRIFYEKHLKFTIAKEWNRDEHDQGVVYSLKHMDFEILKSQENANISGSYLYIQIQNIKEMWEEHKDSVYITQSLKTWPWGHTNFIIKDPIGTKIKFFQDMNVA